MANSKIRLISKILCLGVILVMVLGILCACDKDDDNFRNPMNGEPTSGEFYSLQIAYDNGWISKGDLRNIAYHYAGDAQKKGFKPAPITPLSQEMELSIKESRLQEIIDRHPNTVADEITIDGYFGTYDGFVAIFLGGDYSYYYAVTTTINIGGIEFTYPNSREIIVWKA